MLNVEKHFAQTIAIVSYYENDDDYMKSLQDKCFELEKTTPKVALIKVITPYNTNTLDLYSIPEFDKLNKWVDRQVADYLDIIKGYEHEFPNKEQPTFNIYRK